MHVVGKISESTFPEHDTFMSNALAAFGEFTNHFEKTKRPIIAAMPSIFIC